MLPLFTSIYYNLDHCDIYLYTQLHDFKKNYKGKYYFIEIKY